MILASAAFAVVAPSAAVHAQQRETVEPREASATELELEAAPPPREEGVSVPTATWVFFGVGLGSTALVGLFGGLTLDAQSTFADEPTWEHADTFNALRATTNVAIGVAGAALLGGAIVWVVDAAISKRKARGPREASGRWAVDLSW